VLGTDLRPFRIARGKAMIPSTRIAAANADVQHVNISEVREEQMKTERRPINGKDLVIGTGEAGHWRLPNEYDIESLRNDLEEAFAKGPFAWLAVVAT
jgi:hypothetical protein